MSMYFIRIMGTSGFQLGMIMPSRGHSAMSGDIFNCHNWQGGGRGWEGG